MHLAKTDAETCCLDLVVDCQDVQCGDPLLEAVSISLYSQRDEADCGQHQGWWCEPSMGSRLGSISGNTTNETLRLFEDAAREALEWMIEDGVANGVEVVATYSKRVIQLTIDIDGPNNCSFVTSANEVDYGWVWNGYITRA